MSRTAHFHGALLLAAFLSSCGGKPVPQPANTVSTVTHDFHSYSNPEQARVTHADLDLAVSFERKTLEGSTTLSVERKQGDRLVLDTRDLKVAKVETASGSGAYSEAKFELGAADKILGAPLTVQLPPGVNKVRIHYATSPGASGLQWLVPEQTAGKKHPFLFSQSQAIHARSWVPLQDTPAVRFTYAARIRVPDGLLAVMSAENDPKRKPEYTFTMPQAIPSYLMAIAVGDLEFRAMGPRTGIYAEPPVAAKAAKEFEDTEKMIDATEALYGKYRWGRYDLLVLPPSFPYGGMENPRLTFATPTVIAGDKSLVGLVAHELAHSWSGNLVTNATWRDFWLNEGFTVYVEHRIVETVFGKERADMERVLGRQNLERTLKSLDARDQILHIDLKGRDPDDGVTDVPYVKGALLLQALEDVFGREKFDPFVRGYFDHFAFRSITTEQFVEYLRRNLLDPNPELAARIPLEEWIGQPGLPINAPRPVSTALARVEGQTAAFFKETPPRSLDTKAWSTHEWLHFLYALDGKVDAAKMKELDAAFGFTKSGNSEILQEWLLLALKNRYEAAYPRVEQFLTSVGRRKYLKPLYEEMAKTDEGKKRGRAIYAKARAGYHPIAQTTVDAILK